LAQLFFNFGPNTTTFIIPGECFPTRYRSTGHGLSAAMGKIGAIIAQVIANPLLSIGADPNCKGTECHPWIDHLMQIFALFMLCGTLVSFWVPETKGRTLEELAGEKASSLDQHPHNFREDDEMTWWEKLNFFGKGKPAGFMWRESNLGPRSPGLRGKRMRFGIMTSPELIPKPGEKRHSKGHGEKRRDDSYESSKPYSVSVTTTDNGRMKDAEEDDDMCIHGGPGRSPSGVMPGWGAGWNVQAAEGRGARVESILLNDVGRLLK